MRKASAIELDSVQREKLMTLANSNTAEVRVARRAGIVLWCRGVGVSGCPGVGVSGCPGAGVGVTGVGVRSFNIILLFFLSRENHPHTRHCG
jgi:hypothetical protein